MKVTRDVIFDLLPAYFAGEASPDTRALVDGFFVSDPEFARMVERFRRLNDERDRPAAVTTDAGREREVFERARARFKLRQMALAFTMAAGFGLVMVMLVPGRGRFGWAHPGFLLGLAFGISAALTWLASYGARPDRWFGRD
jgi:anti-sigma factor RsiW